MTWVGGYQLLPVPSGGQGAAYAVSADGRTVVGYVSLSEASSSTTRACWWTSRLGPEVIGPDGSNAWGVSGDGSAIVGTGPTGTFYWTLAGGYVPFDPAYGSWANAISADGTRIVGSSYPGSGTTQPCYWDVPGFVRVNLTMPPGYIGGRAEAVSADGSFIVGDVYLADGNTTHAFRWTAASGLVDLGVAPGMAESFGMGVADDGTAVGYFYDTPHGGGQTIFTWTPDTGFVMPVSSDVMYGANAISGDGSTIVGYGFWPNIDTATNENMAYMVNGVATTPAPTAITDAFTDVNTGDVSYDGKVIVGYSGYGLQPYVFILPIHLIDSELVFQPETTFVDFSSVTTRRLFIASSGTPQWMGQNGATPFGAPPAIYLTTEASPYDFAKNNGHGGSFAVTDPIAPAGGPGCTPYYITESAGAAANPEWRLSISEDGGRTWSRMVRPRTIGALGQYLTRLRWLKMGQSRQRMIKLECTDPVRRNIKGIYIDADQGMT